MQHILYVLCWIYNSALEERILLYQQYKKFIGYNDQQNELPQCRKDFLELENVYAQILRDPLLRLDKAFKSFFRRIKKGEKAGFPRFKSRDRYDSFTYTQLGFKFIDGKIKLSSIGNLRFRSKKFKITGTIKTCTIKRDINKWYIYFSTEVEKNLLLKTNKQVGVDVGIKNFAVLSDGEIIENPKFLKVSEKRLKRKQRKLSIKKKCSKNRNKQRIIVAKQHRKIREQRKDFQHKLSRKLVNENDVIVFEDLRIKNMIKNHCLAKSISDVAWSQFINFTKYKAEEAGREVIFVDPRGTSIICSGCGVKVPKTLADRIHCCPSCGLEIDRDLNAAINILDKSTVGISGINACGENGVLANSLKQEHLFSRLNI
jgi:putative transposase